jgi:diadenosine tetraphosphatase ApaH/serine/threonine PP2A family protein phosphatase
VRYLLLSDIHANLHALDAVIADAAPRGYDAVLVLGDLVGYGGDPNGVIERTLALEPAAMIRGNHDKVAAGLEPSVLFNEIARRSIEWTAKTLTPGHLRLLAELPKGPRAIDAQVEISHGSPFDEDYYIFDVADAHRALAAASAPWSFFGHTHVPMIFATSEAPVTRPGDDEDTYLLPQSGAALVNVGSVGQPRDGDPRAAYGLLDVERRLLELRRVAYDIAGAQQRILDAGQSPYLALRLERGQ